MKGEDLLHAMENIKDEYIEEADRVPDTKNASTSEPCSEKKQNADRKIIRIRPAVIISVAAACLLLAGVFRVLNHPKMNAMSTEANQEAAAEDAAMEEAAEEDTALEKTDETAALETAAEDGEAMEETDEKTAVEAAETGGPEAEPVPEEAAGETAPEEAAEEAAPGNAAVFGEDREVTDAGEHPEVTDTYADAEGEESAETQIANPFISCGTIEEAEKLAGFSFPSEGVRDAVDSIEREDIRAIKDSMIEIIYFDTAGEEIFRIRKGSGSEDISGDYNEYAEQKTSRIRGAEVSMMGDDGRISVAKWTNDGYSFAVCAEDHPMTPEEMKSVIECMR